MHYEVMHYENVNCIPFIYIYLGRTLPYPVHELPLIKWSGSFGVNISSIN